MFDKFCTGDDEVRLLCLFVCFFSYSLFWTVVQNFVIMPIIFHLFLQIVILESMVLDASRNVVDVQIWMTVTGTLENVCVDVIRDTTLPSVKIVSILLVITRENCEGALRRNMSQLNSR